MQSRKHFVFCCLVFSAATLFCRAQVPQFLWAKHFGGSQYDESVRIATDAAGYIYIGGEFYDTASFGNFTLVPSGPSLPMNDAFIAKADSNGNIIWVKQISGDGGQYFRGVTTDDSCNVYITGLFYDATVIGTDTLPQASTSSYDIYIAKYDSSGNFKWARREGGPGEDQSTGISVDQSGNVFVTGFFSGSYTFGNTPLTSTGQYDIYIAKYNRDGIPLWSVSAGGSHSDYGYGIANDRLGNVFITGAFGSNGYPATFGNVTLTPTGGSGMDVYLAKYDADGNFLWVRQAGGTGKPAAGDEGYGVDVDANGNAFVTGIFYDTAYFANDTVVSAGLGDAFVAKYDPQGNLAWVMTGGGTAPDFGYSIALDDAGNVYACGDMTADAQFGSTILNDPMQLNFLFVVKYTNNGNFVWAKDAGAYAGNGYVTGRGIATCSNNVYCTGSLGLSQVSFDANNLTSYGNADAYLARIADPFITGQSDGEDVFIRLFPNPSSNGRITISGWNRNDLVDVRVFDVNGKEVIPPVAGSLFNGTLLLPAKGVYLVVIETKKGRVVKRVMWM